MAVLRDGTVVPAHLEYLYNPARASEMDHVNDASGEYDRAIGRRRWRGAAGGSRRHGGSDHTWRGLTRWTVLEAAQDFHDYVASEIKVHERASGRPDFYMDDNGTLHLDLPAARTVTKARKASKSASPERALIERLQARMLRLMQPGDFAEAKAGVGRQQIVTAVGQLKLRKHETRSKGRMFLVVPQRPQPAHERWIKSEGITLIIEKEASAA